MSRPELTPFSYAVLALVGEGGAGPHDLVRMMRQGRLYWSSAESQWYAEPKRLEQLGYLTSRKEPGQTRERTVYLLTDAGCNALRAWISEPSALPRIQSEAIVRLLGGDLAESDDALLASLQAIRADIADVAARPTLRKRPPPPSPTASATSASCTSWAGGCCGHMRNGSTASSGSSAVGGSRYRRGRVPLPGGQPEGVMTPAPSVARRA